MERGAPPEGWGLLSPWNFIFRISSEEVVMPPFLKRNVLWFSLILGLTLSGSVWAAPVLKDVYFPQDIYANKEVQFKYTFEWAADEGPYEIKAPQNLGLKNMELLDLGQSQETYSTDSGPVSRLVLIYRVETKTAGQGTINSFHVLYRKPRAMTWGKIPVPAATVEIKPALPLKRIFILSAIILAIVLPFAIWFISASRAERKHEENFQIDPKQQLYADAVKKFDSLIAGHTRSYLQTLLSEWSDLLLGVVMTYYTIPIRPTTNAGLFQELSAKNIPAGELREIENLVQKLEHFKYSTGAITSDGLEEIRLLLLQYAKGKLNAGSSNP